MTDVWGGIGSMLRITSDTIVYVLCPSRIVTGGIEAVHQLVDKLRLFGHQAFIVPVPAVSNPVLLQYRNYDASYSTTIIDHPSHVLITTEVNPSGLDPYHSVQKAIWWLSVDFHEALSKQFDFDGRHANLVTHFVQSAYAYSYLKAKGIVDIHYLTDYLNQSYFSRVRPDSKHNRVLYTPVKGAASYIRRLMAVDPSIQWLELSGMIKREHARAMRQGKVYVDFGSHPGKDRQPREAVVNGCCVIVGLAGAACFEQDLPIPDRYKFDLRHMEEGKILETIRDCLRNHEVCFQDFQPYASVVRADEERFEEEIRSIFGVKSGHPRRKKLIALFNILAFARQNNPYVVVRGLMNEWIPLSMLDLSKRIYRSLRAARA